MLDRLKQWLFPPSPLAIWSVRIEADAIVTSDGIGTTRRLAIDDLARVVVATDDSGPWGADFVYLLYGPAPDPVGIFPIEAEGCLEFVDWLSARPGYDGRALQRAAGSTSVARFTVFERDS